MSFKTAFRTQAVAYAILYLVKDADRKGLIREIVERVEEISRKNLGSNSEKVQMEICEKVLLPFCRELLGDTKDGRYKYHEIIAREFTESDQRLRRAFK